MIELFVIEEFGGVTLLLNSKNEINARDFAKYGKIFCGKQMSNIDPAVERDKQALEKELTYRSLGQDLDRVLDDPGRAMFAETLRAGHGIYGVASEFVLDRYYAKGVLEPLVKSYSEQPYRVASRFDRLLRHLEEAGRGDLIERFWTAIARRTRAEFFYQRPRRDHGDHGGAEEFKNYALEAYTQGIDWLRRMGRDEAAEHLTEERDVLREERLPTLPSETDPRRIDESLFWELIAGARNQTVNPLEQVALLGESLRAFKAAEIKRFGSYYAKWMRKLYHWNVWALAYAARGGASDAAFEAFRTWLILQGDPSLVELVVSDPARAAERVPREPDLPEGHCLPMIEEAYFLRQGAALPAPTIDLDRPRGKEWSEATLGETFPELVEHYGSWVG